MPKHWWRNVTYVVHSAPPTLGLRAPSPARKSNVPRTSYYTGARASCAKSRPLSLAPSAPGGAAVTEKAKTPAVQTLAENSVLHYPSSYLSPFSFTCHSSYSVLLKQVYVLSLRIAPQSEHKFSVDDLATFIIFNIKFKENNWFWVFEVSGNNGFVTRCFSCVSDVAGKKQMSKLCCCSKITCGDLKVLGTVFVN